MRAIDVFYARVDINAVMEFVDKRARPYLQSTIHAAAHHDALHELPKITTVTDGARRIVDRPPIISHPAETDPVTVAAGLASYRESLQEDRRVLLDRYHVVDARAQGRGCRQRGPGRVRAVPGGWLRRLTRCSSRPRRPRHRSSSASPLQARTGPTASGWSPGSGCSRPPTTCSWAGALAPGAVMPTCDSSRTRRGRRWSR